MVEPPGVWCCWDSPSMPTGRPLPGVFSPCVTLELLGWLVPTDDRDKGLPGLTPQGLVEAAAALLSKVSAQGQGWEEWQLL